MTTQADHQSCAVIRGCCDEIRTSVARMKTSIAAVHERRDPLDGKTEHFCLGVQSVGDVVLQAADEIEKATNLFDRRV